MHNTPNLIGLYKSAGLFDDDMTVEEALDALVNHPKGLKAGAKYLDRLAADGNKAVHNMADKYGDKVPEVLGALSGSGAGASLAALLASKGKFGIPAGVAAIMGGSAVGGLGGGWIGNAIGDRIKSASMEKRALNAHQLIQQLRSAAIKTNLGIMPDALNRAWNNLIKRNKAVKAVADNRASQHLAADRLFGDIAAKNGMDPLAALSAGRDGKLTGDLAAAFKERQRTGNRIPLDVFMSERNPMGMVMDVNDLKRMENMTYPHKSLF